MIAQYVLLVMLLAVVLFVAIVPFALLWMAVEDDDPVEIGLSILVFILIYTYPVAKLLDWYFGL